MKQCEVRLAQFEGPPKPCTFVAFWAVTGAADQDQVLTCHLHLNDSVLFAAAQNDGHVEVDRIVATDAL